MKLYIAGPMTGKPYHNIPAFEEAAEKLRAEGHECIVPIELDGNEYRTFCLSDPTGLEEGPDGRTWGDFLSRDVKCVADEVDGLVVLEGWHHSKGARLEAFIAVNCGKPVFNIDMQELNPYAIEQSIMYRRQWRNAT